MTELRPLTDDGDRISITDVSGTVAKFEMSYSSPDGASETFRPNWREGKLAYIYFGLCTLFFGIVGAAHLSPMGTPLHEWVVERDMGRAVPSLVLALCIFISGLAALLQTRMRGVLISSEGVESRAVQALGFPRVERLVWPQIYRVILSDDDTPPLLELWDHRYERLPLVSNVARMQGALLHHAAKHGIAITRLD